MTAGLPYSRSDGGKAPGRYDDIDLTATGAMQRAAKRGKALREKHRRGGKRKGLAMANRILSGDPIHPDNVRDMFAFFERFASEAQKQRGTERWDTSSDKVGPLRIAWDLWGGDSGRAWSRRKRAALDRADEEGKRYTLEVCGPVVRALEVQAGETPRDAYWRAWLDAVQRPTERAIRAQWRAGRGGIFPAQSQRYADRVGRVLGGQRSVTRADVTDEELRAILMSDAELVAVREAFDDETVARGVRRAYALVARRLMDELDFDPTLDPTNQIIAQMVTQVQQVTKDRIAKLVRSALAEGASVGDLQRAIILDQSFSPARALTIARTETARTVSEGQEMAFNQAANLGVSFMKEWVSSRDDAVRPTHVALDGQKRQPGEPFDSESGASGPGPGLFFVPEEDINCRCVARPVDIQG